MRSIAAALALAGILLVLQAIEPGSAHDSWISRGGYRNAAGEWCCGDNDCVALSKDDVIAGPNGWQIKSIRETVPYSEGAPSPDGKFWRCKRPDGSRRCFFAPPQSW